MWIRGGFPDSYLAESDEDSFAYRSNFIRTYLERDVPQFGPRTPAETLERLWTMLAVAPERTQAGFYRTSAGAKIDLLLLLPGKTKPWAIEIKYGLSPKPSRGFHQAIEDLGIQKAFVVYSGNESFPLSKTTAAKRR